MSETETQAPSALVVVDEPHGRPHKEPKRDRHGKYGKHGHAAQADHHASDLLTRLAKSRHD